MHLLNSLSASVSASPAGQGALRWLRRWHPWLLAAVWVATQLLLLWQYHGPRHVNDSARYLEYAHNIAREGRFEHDHNLRYVGYPLFMSLWLKLGAGWWGIVLGQMAVSGLAAAAFYRALRRLTPPREWAPAALATAALVGWRDTQNFNAYLLTESLFTSLLILSFAALVWAREGGLGRWVLAAGVVVLASVVRPNGFIVALAAVLAGLAQLRQLPGRRAYYLALVALVLLTPLWWHILNKLLLTFTLVETYVRGEIIYAFTPRVVEPTEPLLFPPDHLGPVLRLGYFILHNPAFCVKLASLKGLLFISYVKTYYSWTHIVMIVAFIYPCYWLALGGLRARGAWLPARVFLGSLVLLQGLVVMLTVEDWDVRFLLPVLPCVFALAGLEVNRRLTARHQIEEADSAMVNLQSGVK